jgi:ubiquinone/menaquinone biosynthesis C-methylase UbiE
LHVTAIDLTPTMIRRLTRRAARLGLPLDARVMDAHELNYADGSFDVVILHLILAVVPDPVKCIREVQRVLRPGGRAVVLDKFVSEGASPGFVRRLFNPVAQLCHGALENQPLRGASKPASGLSCHTFHE